MQSQEDVAVADRCHAEVLGAIERAILNSSSKEAASIAVMRGVSASLGGFAVVMTHKVGGDVSPYDVDAIWNATLRNMLIASANLLLDSSGPGTERTYQ